MIAKVRHPIIAGIVLATTACVGSQTPAPDLPSWRMTKDSSGVEVRILEKPPYTYLYAIDGTLREIRYDSDGDKVADVFAHFSGRAIPDRLEIDGNQDGKIDRWDDYDIEGTLIRYATSAKGGVPDRFIEVDPKTQLTTRIETDADQDGRRERVELFIAGRMTRAEIDTNGDGIRDRVQIWEGSRMTSEELDIDGDRRPDVRIVHSKTGTISKVERLKR